MIGPAAALLLAAMPTAGRGGPFRLAFQSSFFADPASAAGSASAAKPPPAAGERFDFDLLPPTPKASAVDAARIESALHTRRTMLTLHQAFGIATAVGMAATVIFGQLSYSDRFGGLPATGRWELWHDWFLTGTTVAFATAGLLALLAPVPIPKKNEGIDTITVHKYSMLAATIGMVSEIVLGIVAVSREGFLNQPTLATTHLVIGYATAGFVATGVGALFFE